MLSTATAPIDIASGRRPAGCGPAIRTHLSLRAFLAASCAALLAIAHICLAAGAPASAGSAAPKGDLASGLLEGAPDLSYEIYQVQAGDTIENIAARFGVSPGRIRRLNGLSSLDHPGPGQSLAIPIPRLPGAESHARAAQPPRHAVPPRYAVVTTASPIVSEPADSPTAQVFYQPAFGAQLVVTAEQGSYWGVVMIDGSTGWIAKSALHMTERTITPEALDTMLQGGRPDVVHEAFRYLGTPYRYGGRLPYNLDCSLLVQTVFAARGLSLPRTAAAQYEFGHPVNHTDLLPGDRLYFVSKSGRINHTGIYTGGGRFIHASSRRGRVAVDDLSESLYWTRFVGARRS